MNIGIAGASGYTGVELLRVLSRYKDLTVNQITSRQFAGKNLTEIFPFFKGSKYQNLLFSENLDISASDFFFLCLPHEASLDIVKRILDAGRKVIDLSGAYRIKNISAYPEYYGFYHIYPDLLKKAVYGLPEIFREKIKDAYLVANPGCYPTATLLGIIPAVKSGLILEDSIVVTAYSGISGAGRSLKQQFHFPEAFADSYAYKPKKHRHIPEMEDVIFQIANKNTKVRFTPHILPVSRGMICTINFKVETLENELIECYKNFYKNECFIRIVDTPSHIKNVVGTNYCDIFVSVDDRTNYATVISVIDNLGKGASLQAVQNFNIMTGKEETQNLIDLPLYP